MDVARSGRGGRHAVEHDGLIIREPDPADRRAHTARLTPEGEARHAAAQADMRAMEAELLRDLSATERRSLLAVLPRLAEQRTR